MCFISLDFLLQQSDYYDNAVSSLTSLCFHRNTVATTPASTRQSRQSKGGFSMPAAFVDQVQKLDIRAMLAAAFKAGPSDHYTVYYDGSRWHPRH
jgi:hypothetical protein